MRTLYLPNKSACVHLNEGQIAIRYANGIVGMWPDFADADLVFRLLFEIVEQTAGSWPEPAAPSNHRPHLCPKCNGEGWCWHLGEAAGGSENRTCPVCDGEKVLWR